MQLHELATPAVEKNPSKRLSVYTIIDKPDRSHWTRIGVAWVNRDQSINIHLDALPVNGKLHVRDAPERPEAPVRGT